MPEGYEDLHDIEHMDDQELEDLIVQQLRDDPDLDADEVDVQVEDGFVSLGGRVGSEMELQQVAQIVTDVLGIESYSNEIVVNELERHMESEAADEAVAEEQEVASQIGDAAEQTDPAADHLIEDLEAEMYGTHDVQQAIEGGVPYEPPDRPIQDGSWSEENH